MTEEERKHQMALGFKMILEGLGIDLDDPHFRETPRRAARAWYDELCAGLTQSPPPITLFPTKADEMIVLQDIPVRSMCAHHLLPFVGAATVAYVPGREKLLGISKLSRIVNHLSRRPQVQEELTSQIADFIATRVVSQTEETNHHGTKIEYSGGVGVMIRANHMCMALRGVNHDGNLVTSALRGVFLTKPEARAEFLELARTQ